MIKRLVTTGLFLSVGLSLMLGQAREITGKCTIPDGPEWIRDAVFYQIYPQTFYDSNGDGIGDLIGIIQKLDYVKSLGVNAIWLNPFFDSPFNDAGYDIRDYYKVAPRYGTNEDAKRLFEEAHKRGMKVIFDYVITYTAIDHPWFVESCKQKPNKYTNWYVWNDNVWKMEEGEFANRFIQGYGQRNGNFMRNFYWSQPALNFGFGQPDTNKKWQMPTNHPDVLAMREELKRIFCYWMDLGADGIRADMAGALVKGNDVNGDTKKFWKEIRQIVQKKYPQAFMVSEWSYPKDALDGLFHADFFHWFDGYNDLAQKESWRILNGYSEGHSFFDKEGKGNIAYFLSKYMEQYNETKTKGYILLPLGNHDNARMNVNRTDDELEMIMAFGITMPGIPFIYYGNEIGMRELYDMPQIEGAYKPRAGARTPMQWTPGKNRGFSTADFSKLYLPIDTSNDAPNVETEQQDPNSLLSRVKKLIELKHTEPALAAFAEFVPLYAKENTYPLVYARANGKDEMLIILNPAEKTVTAEFQVNMPYKKLQLLAGKEIKVTKNEKTLKIEVPGIMYAVYKVQ
ncbi:MAG: alpha-amylase family glycosyl hydrolase [Ignavibacteriales bacterium]|nr:alpha-amylase family glycosyl hydrolase [Ignavibacteriales bacterium]